MEPQRFDQLSRFFAERRLSRRRAFRQIGIGGLAAGLTSVAVGPVAAAQSKSQNQPLAVQVFQTPVSEATAEANPAVPETAKPTTFMFVQSFAGGSLVPQAGQAGRYTLTLPHGLGDTIYFSDRPQRLVGAVPTDQFLKGMPFGMHNPPNAVLIGHQSPTHEDLVVLELFNPRYDTTTHTATYDAQLLKDMHEVDLVFSQTPDQETRGTRTYTDSHLFIDDCPDNCYWCERFESGLVVGIGVFKLNFCWKWLPPGCYSCQAINPQTICQQMFPDDCGDGKCWMDSDTTQCP